MSHERVFDFPFPTASKTKVNALNVGAIVLQPDNLTVFIYVSNAQFFHVFTNEQEATDFINLWVTRVEEAK